MPRRAGGRGGSGHKHHVKKETTSRYKDRLAARGLGKAPEMKSLKELRKRDGVRGGDELPEVA